MKTEIDAKKETQGRKEALALLDKASRAVIAKGKKRIDFDLKKDPPSRDDLLSAALGPTGNLRAPTLVVGKTVVIGFQPEMYEEVLG